MGGVNKVIILGRLGRDPEISYSQSGMAVCKLSLATSRKQKDGTEVTSWHRCTAFDKSAELISQYVSKGRELYIEGELQYGQYEKDGIVRYTTDIIIRQFSFVGGRSDVNTQAFPEQNNADSGGYNRQNTGSPDNVSNPVNDDIPF